MSDHEREPVGLDEPVEPIPYIDPEHPELGMWPDLKPGIVYVLRD